MQMRRHKNGKDFETDRLTYSNAWKAKLASALLSTRFNGDAMWLSPTVKNMRELARIKPYLWRRHRVHVVTRSNAGDNLIAVWVR